jgi:hypothetical protein
MLVTRPMMRIVVSVEWSLRARTPAVWGGGGESWEKVYSVRMSVGMCVKRVRLQIDEYFAIFIECGYGAKLN